MHEHRNLLAHAPERLHEEVSADYADMMWCRENFRGLFAVEPIRDAACDTGRRFRFADEADATAFRRRWG